MNPDINIYFIFIDVIELASSKFMNVLRQFKTVFIVKID